MPLDLASPGRAILRIAVYLALTLLLIPVQMAALRLGLRLAVRLPVFYHRRCCRILGLDVRVHGQRSTAAPTLFVCNHASYLDIAVLASQVPGSFISKAEVASWPLFGLLAKLQRTVFVERRGARAAAQRDEIGARLARGDNLILFPEGTSADGLTVRPFKSALFSVAKLALPGREIVLQPVSLAYTRLDGMPIGRGFKPLVAWYGEMAMAAHMFGVAGLGTISVDLTFHPPVLPAAFESRKALSDHCHEIVADGLAAANAGRLRAVEGGARRVLSRRTRP